MDDASAPDSQSDQARALETLERKIQEVIDRIATLVQSHDALQLMKWCYLDMVRTMMGKVVESEMGEEEHLAARLPEYVQSVIVSTVSQGDADVTPAMFDGLKEQVREMYRLLILPHALATSALERDGSGTFNEDVDDLRTASSMHRLSVRGNRYVNHDFAHLREFLRGHEAAFVREFGVTPENIVSGLERLYHSLSRGIGEAVERARTISEAALQQYQEWLDQLSARLPTMSQEELDRIPDPHQAMREVMQRAGFDAEIDRVNDQLFGEALVDVLGVSGLPEPLVAALAYGPGDNRDFFATPAPGWPTKRLPVTRKPFLRLSNRYYCFEQVSFLDHIYHNLRDALLAQAPGYATRWEEVQKENTERTTLELLCRLLPGATQHSPYHYDYTDNGTSGFAEADGLLIYGRTLIVVEVKGGQISHRAPGERFGKYLNALNKLVSAPAEQALRFLRELDRLGAVTIYDRQREHPITTLHRTDFDQIYVVTSTLEYLGHLTADPGNAGTLRINTRTYPVWAVGIDDLRVIAELIDGPIQFLHFLEQRMQATSIEKFRIHDELDHLALYFKRNRYADTASEYGAADVVAFHGLTDAFETYFGNAWRGVTPNPKPMQEMPVHLRQIIGVLGRSATAVATEAGKYLLDYDGVAREQLNALVQQLFVRRADGRVRPISVMGAHSLSAFIFFPDTRRVEWDEETCRRYALAAMQTAGENRRLMLRVLVDDQQEVQAVWPTFLVRSDVESAPQEQLRIDTARFAASRVRTLASNRKIGRNEQCPCGSGFKYKRCHGRT